MSVRIEVAELGLPALDALDVDALLVFVGPERPLQGLAGFADWRLCGALSRAMRSGLFAAAPGEALLLPSGGRLRPARVFCFGLPAVPVAAASYPAVVRSACQALRRAYRILFRSHLPLQEAQAQLRAETPVTPEVIELVEFVAGSERGVIR